ncbi:hypothetical protein SADUNF_Sadunf12G0043000 [Salix dunnii]|uniref:Homeobox domain-containing protein n=1 Tax=Salix dunnii TaxID=1413687 RepID=A0A835JQV4_9ROSI|nr:hypothetical protein SADUNF_Sadunf12G0043000 [Salix dunnii]
MQFPISRPLAMWAISWITPPFDRIFHSLQVFSSRRKSTILFGGTRSQEEVAALSTIPEGLPRSSSELALDWGNMMEGQFHHLDMAHNTYESDMTRIRDEEFDSANTKSGNENQEGGSGDEQDPRPKRKRYHRHTQHQIQEMEAFFKECLHPDNKQRKELSRELGLELLQIKFWFQNKYTQMKTQHERHENKQLEMRMKSLGLTTCEIDRISAVAARYVGKPVRNYPVISPPMPPRPVDLSVENFRGKPGIGVDIYEAGDLLRSIGVPTEAEKTIIIELAVATMKELIRMTQMDEPL